MLDNEIRLLILDFHAIELKREYSNYLNLFLIILVRNWIT